jgi:outer membrane protein assembly factor BamB
MKRFAFPTPDPESLWQSLGLALVFIFSFPAVAAATETSPAGAHLIASPEAGWPQFRGSRRDGISDERGLLPSWPEGGPRLLWSLAGAGRGYSSPTIAGGRLYVTGDFGEELRILAFDLQGKPLWSATNGSSWLNQHQGARASVTYSAGRIYHQNAHGRVACLDAASGKEFWAVDLLTRFGGENITWGLSECLLVDERAVFATAGGRNALLVALDKRTGALLWQTGPLIDADDKPGPQTAGYASPILVRFAGRRLLIGCSSRHLYCADADTGKIQWTQGRPTSYSVLAMMPVLVGDAVFMSAPFGPPGRLYRLRAPVAPGGTVGVEESWSTGLDTAQGGVVHVDGRLFGSYYPRRGGWAALDATTGKVLYDAPDMIKGAALHADNRLYALCEDGWMLLLHPTATEFEVKGRFRLAMGRDRDAWAHPVILDGRLYLRYHDTLQCHDIRAAPPP